MKEQRLLEYLAVDRQISGAIQEYCQLVLLADKTKTLKEESLSYAYLAGHFQGMLDDLIELIGKTEVMNFLGARACVTEKLTEGERE